MSIMGSQISTVQSQVGAGSGHTLARPPNQSLYELRGVSKTFHRRNVRALDRIDLTLHERSFSSVIGPSGCGKSTLLQIMAGLLRPSEGTVTLAGELVTGPRPDIGIMFQHATLLPWRSTLDNVLLPIEIREGKGAANRRRQAALELLDITGLRGFENAYPHELSGGMAQRAAICRMLITEPKVLLLDEPFGALDELTREHMDMELQRIFLQRATCAFLVTHSIPEAVLLSDVVYVMSARPGRIVGVVHVDLPRPRTLDITGDVRFGELVREVRSLLDKGASP